MRQKNNHSEKLKPIFLSSFKEKQHWQDTAICDRKSQSLGPQQHSMGEIFGRQQGFLQIIAVSQMASEWSGFHLTFSVSFRMGKQKSSSCVHQFKAQNCESETKAEFDPADVSHSKILSPTWKRPSHFYLGVHFVQEWYKEADMFYSYGLICIFCFVQTVV